MKPNYVRKSTLKKDNGSKYDRKKILLGRNKRLGVKRMQIKEMHAQKLERMQISKIKM